MFLKISQNSQENTCARGFFFNEVAGLRYHIETSPWICRANQWIGFYVISQACNFIKVESLANVFSCEICEISKNTLFTEHVWTTASYPDAELLLSETFTIYSLSSPTLPSKNNRCFNGCTKANCVCFDEVIWLTTMKMRLKMKSRSQRYEIYRPMSRHGYKCTKYKMCHSIMMVICIKQHLSSRHLLAQS